jgi:3-hydroxyacyl-[acyl-carrier-protein] dehydratase
MNDPLEEALSSLPHGPEFRFLDRLLALDPGKTAVGEYTVRGDEPALAGHFPGEPLFPGVLLLEAAAQLSGIVIQSGSPDKGRVLRLAAIRAAKILGSARPGESLRVEARLLGSMGALFQTTVSISVLRRAVLHAELTLSSQDPARTKS